MSNPVNDSSTGAAGGETSRQTGGAMKASHAPKACDETPARRRWIWLLPLALITLALGGLLVHAASEQPDGLEKVAEGQGFAHQEGPVHEAPVPDYELPWYRTALGKSLVGVGGALLAFGVAYGIGWALRRRRGEPGGAPHVRS